MNRRGDHLACHRLGARMLLSFGAPVITNEIGVLTSCRQGVALSSCEWGAEASVRFSGGCIGNDELGLRKIR